MCTEYVTPIYLAQSNAMQCIISFCRKKWRFSSGYLSHIAIWFSVLVLFLSLAMVKERNLRQKKDDFEKLWCQKGSHSKWKTLEPRHYSSRILAIPILIAILNYGLNVLSSVFHFSQTCDKIGENKCDFFRSWCTQLHRFPFDGWKSISIVHFKH